MIKTIQSLMTLALSIFSVCVFAESLSSPHADIVQKTIYSLMAKNNIPGVAVELYINGKPYEYYYGYADREKKLPVSNNTIFEVGSLSSVMTSLLLAQEIDWAKMSLNDPITKYVKEVPESFHNIKLQDLATYTSSLPFNLPKNINTQAELKKYLTTWSADADPGEQWLYSNVSVGLLGFALESSTEKDFANLYRRHILNPLRMVVGVTIPQKLVKYYAQGYDQNGHVVSHSSIGLFPAAASINASAQDMQRFLSAAIGLPGTPPRVFYPMRMTQSMYVKLADKFQGLAWQIHPISGNNAADLLYVSDAIDAGSTDVQAIYSRPTYNGNALIDKSGGTQGFRAYVAVLPNKKSGIVILANKNVANYVVVKAARELLFKLTNLV